MSNISMPSQDGLGQGPTGLFSHPRGTNNFSREFCLGVSCFGCMALRGQNMNSPTKMAARDLTRFVAANQLAAGAFLSRNSAAKYYLS